jgi:hypothetical protein
MQAISLEIDTQIKPLVDELNKILEDNVSLLRDLDKMTTELETSPICDLPSYRKKMERRITNIKSAIVFNDRRINDISEKMNALLNPFKPPVMVLGSVNF